MIALACAFAMMRSSPVAAGDPPSPHPPACGPDDRDCTRLRARVEVAGERTLLAGVRVHVTPAPPDARPGRVARAIGKARDTVDAPWALEAVTDAAGEIVLPALPAMRVRIVIIAQGYEPTEWIVDLARRESVTVFVRPAQNRDYRTIVPAPRREPIAAEITEHRLSREELRTIPGAQSDALRGAQALPGFGRVPGGLGLVVLRGASPAQSLVMLGEHPVPRAFHVVPIAAIVPTDSIRTLSIEPSNFSPRYGPAAGGLVRIEPRDGRRDGVHGRAEIDFIGAGAAVEGPLRKGSYLVGARRAWIDGVLRAVERVDESLVFMLPSYWDYQAVAGGPIAPGVRLEARVFGAGDRVIHRWHTPAGPQETLRYSGQMHRPSLVFTAERGPFRLLASPAVRLGREAFALFGSRSTDRREVAPSWRVELEGRLSRGATVLVGTDGMLARYRGSVETFVLPDTTTVEREDTGMLTTQRARGWEGSVAAYSLLELRRGPVRVVPGARYQAFVVGARTAYAVDPRLNLEVVPAERWSVRAGAGVYSQPQLPPAASSGFFVSQALRQVEPRVEVPPLLIESFEPRVAAADRDDAVGLRRALHGSVGVERELGEGATVGATAFVRLHRASGIYARIPAELTAVAGVPGTWVGEGRGVDYGAELLARKRLTGRLYGWVAYTVMRSVVNDDRGRHSGDFDQRHNLSIVASYGLPRGFRLGARFRLVSGSPYTPTVARVDEVSFGSPQGYSVRGVPNSARFPVFHQLDLRVDKRWVLNRASVSTYFDVQNAYNRINEELFIHEWDHRGRVAGLGLPIFPSLGVRVDW